MNCPECSKPKTVVLETRQVENDNIIYRRRQCRFCKHRWNTYEIPVDQYLERAMGVRKHLMPQAQ